MELTDYKLFSAIMPTKWFLSSSYISELDVNLLMLRRIVFDYLFETDLQLCDETGFCSDFKKGNKI